MDRHINYTILVSGVKSRRVGSMCTIYKVSRRFGGDAALHPINQLDSSSASLLIDGVVSLFYGFK